jgi:S-formylglutathione hydrolase FrmB
MKWALREPWRFAAAASLSGALGLSHPNEHAEADFARLLQAVFGDTPTEGTLDDVRHLLRTADPHELPRLYAACGTEDFLYWATAAFIDLAEEVGVEITTSIGSGEHEWGYWDSEIRSVIDWLSQ